MIRMCLRPLRNVRDYNLFSVVNKDSVNSAKLIVFSLEKEIDNLKPSAELEKAFDQSLKELQSENVP